MQLTCGDNLHESEECEEPSVTRHVFQDRNPGVIVEPASEIRQKKRRSGETNSAEFFDAVEPFDELQGQSAQVPVTLLDGICT